MYTNIEPVSIPNVTSLLPAVRSLAATPVYPGLVKLQITATADDKPVAITSLSGTSYESDTWLYVIERESAILIAIAMENAMGDPK